MSATGRLVFDPTDADSIDASHSVGSFTRSSDGTLIDHKTIAAAEWLNTASAMHSGDGTALTDTAGALDVNIASGSLGVDLEGVYDLGTNANPDNVGIIGHTRAAAPDETDQLIRQTGGILGDDLSNADIHALDTAAFMMAYDGTNFDRVLQTNGALHVDIQDASIAVEDVALADAAIENTAVAVSTTAVNAVASALSGRKYIALANEGNKKMYSGKTGVTAINGFPVHPGERQFWRLGPAVAMQLIGGTGANAEDIRVMELS